MKSFKIHLVAQTSPLQGSVLVPLHSGSIIAYLNLGDARQECHFPSVVLTESEFNFSLLRVGSEYWMHGNEFHLLLLCPCSVMHTE